MVFSYKKFTFNELPETVILSNRQVKPVEEKPLSALTVGDKVTFVNKSPLGDKVVNLTIKSIVSTKFMGC